MADQESWNCYASEETGCQSSEVPSSCADNCGFLGCSDSTNLSSKCYRELVLNKDLVLASSCSLASIREQGKTVQTPANSQTTSLSDNSPSPRDAVSVFKEDMANNTALSYFSFTMSPECISAKTNGLTYNNGFSMVPLRADGPGVIHSSKKHTGNRCHACQKRVGLLGSKCRCGDLFCVIHRYSDKHACSFDYKAAGGTSCHQIRKRGLSEWRDGDGANSAFIRSELRHRIVHAVTSDSLCTQGSQDEVLKTIYPHQDVMDMDEGGFQTPQQENGIPVHIEKPHLFKREQLMADDSSCSIPYSTSPFKYFIGEVLRPRLQQDLQPSETAKRRQHVYNTMFHVPWRFELLIIVGFFVCLDSFLSLLTVVPLRIILFLWRVLAHKRKFQRPQADELVDCGSLLVVVAGVTLLQQADLSYIYHMIRSQATIKLYVVYNVLEIFDKLCQSFGSDVLQVVLNSAENVATCASDQLLFESLRFIMDQCIAMFSFVSHSLIILAEAITVSAAIRSHNNALLTLLISNNFAEIKSNVFKRLGKDNLHKLAYLDTVERFHMIAHLFFVLVQNLLAANDPWLLAFASNAGMVLLCEILVDAIKHAFLAKFNEIKPSAYSDFLLALCKQTLTSQWHEVHNTMAFVPYAPACVVIRILLPLYAAYLPAAPWWRLASAVFYCIVTYIILVMVKILVGVGLLKHANWYVERYKRREKYLHSD